ncbi:hypothetical protein J6590_035537 [Homalodisca vitripennis]|nr:hypothetical protein J6590_035537 [Homalodisca vitripennis]
MTVMCVKECSPTTHSLADLYNCVSAAGITGYSLINGLVDCPDLLVLIDLSVLRRRRSLSISSRRFLPTSDSYNYGEARLQRLGDRTSGSLDFFPLGETVSFSRSIAKRLTLSSMSQYGDVHCENWSPLISQETETPRIMDEGCIQCRCIDQKLFTYRAGSKRVQDFHYNSEKYLLSVCLRVYRRIYDTL